MNASGRRIEIHGIVQGVGFRPWVYRLAAERGLTGRVRNDASGVTIDAFGPESKLASFCEDLINTPPPAAEIRAWRSHSIPVESLDRFIIAGSVVSAERRTSIPPDLATCPECLADIADPLESPVSLRLHQLHALRSALHHRERHPVRPGPHHDGAVQDVRVVPARIRRSGRSPISRSAQRLSCLRAATHAAGMQWRRYRDRRPNRRRGRRDRQG